MKSKPSSPSQHIRILMLDHEPLMIDRRIVLEAGTLVKAGFEVALATRGATGSATCEAFPGFVVHRFGDVDAPRVQHRGWFSRFVDYCQSIASRDQVHIQNWIASPGNHVVEKATRRGSPNLINSALYAFRWPPALAHVLRIRAPKIKKIAGLFFEPIVYLLLLRVDFLLPYLRVFVIRLAIDRANFLRVISGRKPSHIPTWQQKILGFAKSYCPDIVHAHDLPNLALGVQIARSVNAKLIFDAHELYPEQFFSSAADANYWREMEKEQLPAVDYIITVNRQCAAYFGERYDWWENIAFLENAAVEPPGFSLSSVRKLWHQKFNLKSNVRLMVFCGGINPVRKIDVLLEAMCDIPDHIHVGFITYKADVAYYQELSARFGISHRVHYILEIPWSDVVTWLAAGDVGVMPYQANNYNAEIASPNKLYEYVVAGLPIIASTCLVNVRDAVNSDGLGLARPLSSVETYVNVILEMFTHPAGPERFRDNVLRVRANYMWYAQESKLLAAYSEIVRRSESG